MVEVDIDTGDTRYLRHIAVDDCGKILNRRMVDGQVHGGVAQAAGQALLEQVLYDEDSNPLTTKPHHLSAARRFQPAFHRSGPHHHSYHPERPGSQRHRRSRNHRRHPRYPERGHRCAGAPWVSTTWICP